MKYGDLILESNAFKELLSDALSGALSHAYLLLSPDSIMLEGMTRYFIAAAFGRSAASLRKVLNGASVDVVNFPPDGEAKVMTEHIERLLDSVYLTPVEEKYKFFVIDKAETMNETAQNKLLKTLEEPPAHSVIVLKCASANMLLPTVKSRCRQISVSPFAAELLTEELKKYYPAERLEIVAAACRGSLERAEEILEGDGYMKLFSAVTECLMYMKKSPDILKYSFTFLCYKDKLSDTLELFELLLRDCLTVKYDPVSVIFKSSLIQIKDISQHYPEQAILSGIKAVYRAKDRLSRYGNAASIIDEFLFSLLEEKVKCQKL